MAEYIISSGESSDGIILTSNYMIVSDGGAANNTIVKTRGSMYVASGGTANNITVSSGGTLYVSSGGRLMGKTSLASGAVVSMFGKTVLDFDLTQTSAGGVALVNDLSAIRGTPVYTLTVDGALELGTYNLAGKAAGFDQTVSLINPEGDVLGTLALGEDLFVEDKLFSLSVQGAMLTLTVTAPDLTPPTVFDVKSDITTPTKGSVNVTASFADDVELADTLYRIGTDGTWTTYENGVTVAENSTVFFKAVDAAGNESEVVSYTVGNIDRTPPAKPTLSADVTEPTNGRVLVTAVFSEDSVKTECSIDGTYWMTMTELDSYFTQNGTIVYYFRPPLIDQDCVSVSFSQNGTAYFRATDAAGNVSEVAWFTVSNILDTTAPSVKNIKASTTEPTNQDVLVTAEFTDNVAVAARLYSINYGTWMGYVDGVVVVENATIGFKAVDTSGNGSVYYYTVSNIDKIPPATPTATADITTTTTGNVTVTGSFSEDSVKKEYSLDGTNWETYTSPIVFTENGTVYFRGTDAVGNISEVTTYAVTNIKKILPDAIRPTVSNVKASTTEPTRERVVVTADFTDNLELESSLYRVGETGEWKNYPNGGVIMVRNATVYFKAVDAAGNESEVASCTVTNIENTYEIISGLMFQDQEIKAICPGQLYLDATIHEAVVYVKEGGVASGTTLAFAGIPVHWNTWLVLSSGAIAIDTTVNSCGRIITDDGAYVDGAEVNCGGIFAFGGGTATNIAVAEGGTLQIVVKPGAYLQGVSAGSSFEMKDGVLSAWNLVSNSYYSFRVESGGTAIDNNLNNFQLYVSSGGIASNNAINHGGYIRVSSGGLANDNAVNERGTLIVSKGGVANSTNILSGGYMCVSSGGTATNIMASDGALMLHVAPDTYAQGVCNGSAFEMKDALLSDFTIRGFVSVFSGGTADRIDVSSSNSLTVLSGGAAKHVTLNGGEVYLSSGGTLDSAVVNRGSLFIASGATATDLGWTPCVGYLRIEDGAYVTFASRYSGVYYGNGSSASLVDSKRVLHDSMYIMSGGTANGTELGGYGVVYVSEGGTANRTNVSGGSMIVCSGGTANGVTVKQYGSLYVSGGGTATDIVWTPLDGTVRIEGGAYVTFVSQYSGVYVSSAGQAVSNVQTISSQTVSAMSACVMSNGILDHVTIASGGSFSVSSGGTASETLLVSEGCLQVFSGGTANQTTIESGVLDVLGGVANDTLLNSGNKEDSFNSGAVMHVYSGGTANNTEILCTAELIVHNGGTVNNTRISRGYVVDYHHSQMGFLVVSSGGVAYNTVVCEGEYDYSGHDGGLFVVTDGGTASNTTVMSCGQFSIGSGATAYYTIVNPYGSMGVNMGGTIKHTIISGTHWCDASYLRGSADDTILLDEGTLVIDCGKATNTTVKSGGIFIVRYLPEAVEVDNYYPFTAVAENTTVLSGGCMEVFSGGTATNIVASKGASISFVLADNTYLQGTYDGRAFEINGLTLSSFDLYGDVHVSSGGLLNDITVHFGGIYLFSGGYGDGIVLSGGSLYLMDGAANNITVSSGGQFIVPAYYDGDQNFKLVGDSGRADNTVIESGGWFYIAGGTINNTTVNSGGKLELSFKARLTGRITLEKGAIVSVSSGAAIDFDLTKTSAGAAALLNDYSYVSGITDLTLTTDTSVADGEYKLADGVAAFDKTISVIGLSDGTPASLSLDDDPMEIYGKKYSLVLSGETLSVIVGDGDGTSSGGLTIAEEYYVTDGRLVENVTVEEDGALYVSSGGTANNTTINSGCKVYVSSGGKLTGRMTFESGAVVSASAGAILDFDLTQTSTGATALVNDLSVVQGTPTYTLTVDGTEAEGVYTLAAGATGFKGTITVMNKSNEVLGTLAVGETVTIPGSNNTLSLSESELSVSIAKPYAVISSGLVLTNETRTIYKDSLYEKTTINSSGRLNVSSGGTANDTTVNFFGELYVDSGGLTSSTTVNMGGYHLVGFSGTADSTTVNSHGFLRVYSGGTANSTTVNSGGEFSVFSGGTANDTMLFGSIVRDDFYNVVQRIQGVLRISEGEANGTTVNSGGCLEVYMGGVANDTTVNNTFGQIIVFSGGVANGTNVHSGGLYVSSGGVVNGTNAHSGRVVVSSGGAANNTTIDFCGDLYVSSGALVNNTSVNHGGHFVVSSAGMANDAVINLGGDITIASGGTAKGIRENGGFVAISQGANVTFIANAFSDLSLNTNNRSATVHSGTTANNISIYDNGIFYIYTGGVANGTIINSGDIEVSSGGIVNDTIINSGGIEVYSSGIANSTTINGGAVYVCGGGEVNDTIISSGGSLYIYSTGVVEKNTMVHSGGSLFVFSGGTVAGQVTFEDGAVVSAYNGAILDFNISELVPEEEVRFNNLSIVQGAPIYTLTVDGHSKPGSYVYALANGAAGFKNTISVVNTAGDELGTLMIGETVKIGYDDYTLNLTDASLSVTIIKPDMTPQTPVGTLDQVTWEASGADQYIVEYSTDNFEHVILVVTAGNAIDMPDLPAGTYQWRVKADDNSDWTVGEAIVSESDPATPKVVQSNEDGNTDVFFANPVDTWESGYVARHVGSIGDGMWEGTNEQVTLTGRNKLADIFEGSTDANILLMTDDDNGDTLFVDDIYTASPGNMAEQQARIAQIDEIRAGAGDDIVDMTSQRFEYIGDGLTIRGGEGNDTIWANKGDNRLFGDAGNDRIVGASGNDVIAGGIGNDRMHGGGGNDVFTFCDNWGEDNVEQLATGSVTLWFASGDSTNWNPEMLTYSDGTNSVKVSGVTAEKVTLKFGDDGSAQFSTLTSMGAFFDATSERIFEEPGKGILASL